MSETHNTLSQGRGRRLVVLNRDVFFGVKIANTLRSLGFEVDLTQSTSGLEEAVSEGHPRASLAVIDMNAGVDWQIVASLTGPAGPGIPILAFGSHLDVEGFRAAKAAGVTRVVSNGDFHRDMVSLVERYARS